MAARRSTLKKNGTCQDCYVSPFKENSIYCQNCLDKQKLGRQARAESNLCISCRDPITTGTLCERCRIRSRKNAVLRSQMWKQQSKCTKCGSDRDSELSKCASCRQLASESYLRSKKRNDDLGICVDCGKQSAIQGNRRCIACYVKRVAGKRTGDISRQQELQKLFEQQQGVCPYTGLILSLGVNADLDHKVPVSKGGTNAIENLQWVHKMANTMKWHYGEEEFLNMVETIASHRRLLRS